MDKIGRYRIVGRIGAGSFATVLRGHDDDLDSPVAIKVLAENWSGNADVRGRFLKEARLLRRISDERIVRVYDIGTTSAGQPYFVMDFADGGSLERLRRQQIAPGRALRLCAEAARGLEVLHRHQLIHRDVTPGNVLLRHTDDGIRVMLADLGVAKSMVQNQGATMTAGTPAYMALEQANGGALDQRSDVYSMAAVTYAMLTGRPPFPVKTLQDLLSRNHNIGPAAIADQIGAPVLLDQLFAAALHPNPDYRPTTALALAEALDQIAAQLPGGDTYVPRPLSTSLPNAAVASASLGGGFIPQAPAPPLTPTSLPGSGPSAGSITPHSETPDAMLDNYLGKGRYSVAKPKERHSVWFYVWLSVSFIALFGLSLWASLTFFLNN